MKSVKVGGIEQHAIAGSVVRVAVPASVAFNLGRMQEVTKDILGRLGCEGCHSGYDIRFDLIRDYRVQVVGDRMEIIEGQLAAHH